MNRKYEHILHLPRPQSHCRPAMPRADRAAQFASFAALDGYEACIREVAEKEHVDWIDGWLDAARAVRPEACNIDGLLSSQ